MTVYTYNVANELTLIQPPTGAPTTVSYDSNGNQVLENAGGALTTYTWDGENRLVGVSSASGLETHTYDAEGLRRFLTTADGLTRFVWDEQNVVCETAVAPLGSLTTTLYTDFPGYWGGLVSMNVPATKGGVSHFYGFDGQQNARLLTDGSASVTDTYVYTAFGVEKG
jgi:YD repeat-containing protein